VLADAPAFGQGNPIHFTLSGGLTAPLFSTSSRFGPGGSVSLGLMFDASERVSLQGEWMFINLSGEQKTVPASQSPIITTPGIDTGFVEFVSRHEVQYASVNAIVNLRTNGRAGPYLIAGGGLYYRSISITTPGIGFVAMCDPYWFVCYPSPEPVDRIVGHRTSWNPGVSVGGGFTHGIGESSQFFVEVRWHFMTGPTIAGPGGSTRRVTGQYVPLTFGVRF
jgi:hypothetical protein